MASSGQDTFDLRPRLIVDPKKFLEVAEDLVKENPSKPARLRTATSRAYYAAYNFCRQILAEMGFRIHKSSGGHGQVVNFFASSKDEDLMSVSGHLGTLQTNRNTADYDLDVDRAEKLLNVQLHVRQARLIIETVEGCCKGCKRSEIIEAMKVFDDVSRGRPRPSN